MPTCPAGHTSASADYCDVCGELMAGAAPAPPSRAPRPSAPGGGAPASAPDAGASGEPCPVCATPRTGRFCEGCGYDFATGAPGGGPAQATAQLAQVTTPVPAPAPTVSTPIYERVSHGPQGSRAMPPPGGWSAVVSVDRDYFERVLAEMGPDAGALAFPPYRPDRRYLLVGPEVRIGRRSASRRVVPEIDLSVPPEDPGVSHIHAVLLARPDGTWALVDPGSTNGTTTNGGADPIEVNVEIPVHDGDRIHVGAWTTITLRKE